MSELAAAIAKAQAEMANPPLDGKNPHFKSRFATMAAVRDAVIPCFSKHGVAVLQELRVVEHGVECMTHLRHGSETLSLGPTFFPVSKTDAHGIASAYSYARRYSLMAVAVVVGDDDDDGNGAAASGRSLDDQYGRPPEPLPPPPANRTVSGGTTGPRPAPAPATNAKHALAKWHQDLILAAQARKWTRPHAVIDHIISSTNQRDNFQSAADWPAEKRSKLLELIKQGAIDAIAAKQAASMAAADPETQPAPAGGPPDIPENEVPF